MATQLLEVLQTTLICDSMPEAAAFSVPSIFARTETKKESRKKRLKIITQARKLNDDRDTYFVDGRAQCKKITEIVRHVRPERKHIMAFNENCSLFQLTTGG